MIVQKRRRSPRAQNYRTGVWSGLGYLSSSGGWVPDPMPATPKYETCVGANGAIDSTCVSRNSALNAAWLAASNLALYGPNAPENQPDYGTVQTQAEAQAIYNAALQKQNAPVQSAAPASGGRVTFTSSRGGNSLQVGDTWLVSITGATPGKQVTAKVGSDVTPMGTTDSSGNFTLAGTARTADVGAWNETWAVGGIPSGGFSFTVQAAVTPEGKKVVTSSGAGAGTGTGGDAAGGGTGGGTGAGSESTASTSFDFSAIPIWAWAAAAAAALFMFKGGR